MSPGQRRCRAARHHDRQAEADHLEGEDREVVANQLRVEGGRLEQPGGAGSALIGAGDGDRNGGDDHRGDGRASLEQQQASCVRTSCRRTPREIHDRKMVSRRPAAGPGRTAPGRRWPRPAWPSRRWPARREEVRRSRSARRRGRSANRRSGVRRRTRPARPRRRCRRRDRPGRSAVTTSSRADASTSTGSPAASYAWIESPARDTCSLKVKVTTSGALGHDLALRRVGRDQRARAPTHGAPAEPTRSPASSTAASARLTIAVTPSGSERGRSHR